MQQFFHFFFNRYFLSTCFLLASLNSFAQQDTIYTNSEKIACTIKEITPDAVQFTYPNESLTNTLYKNTINKIVFRSGRTQVFSESTSFNTIRSVEDFEKVTITQVEGETKGLFKLGEVNSSAIGGTRFSNIDKVKERALKKLKMEAAMKGANLIYMAYQKTVGNQGVGLTLLGKAAETTYTGIAYTNFTPNKDEFLKKIAGIKEVISNKKFTLLKGNDSSIAEYDKDDDLTTIKIKRAFAEGSQVYLEVETRSFNSANFRVVRFDQSSFTLLAEDKKKVVNYIVPFSPLR